MALNHRHDRPSRATNSVRAMLFVFQLALVLLAVSVGERVAWACTQPPASAISPHPDLVWRTDRIALATYVGTNETHRRALFHTKRVLKGEVGEQFQLPLQAPPRSVPARRSPDHHQHRDMGFWGAWGGPATWGWPFSVTYNHVQVDCSVSATLEVGRDYLVFVDEPRHLMSYEVVESPDDLWLRAVERLIENPFLRSGLVVTVDDFLTTFDAVYIARVIGKKPVRVASVVDICGTAPPENHLEPLYTRIPEVGELVLVLFAQSSPSQFVPITGSTTQAPAQSLHPSNIVDLHNLGGQAILSGRLTWSLVELEAELQSHFSCDH